MLILIIFDLLKINSKIFRGGLPENFGVNQASPKIPSPRNPFLFGLACPIDSQKKFVLCLVYPTFRNFSNFRGWKKRFARRACGRLAVNSAKKSKGFTNLK